MLKNIENFDGWFEVNSYEDIVLGKGELTLEVKSLKAMMKYMPIIQELDKVVGDINSYNKIMIQYINCGRYNTHSPICKEVLKTLEDKVIDFYKELDKYGLVMANYQINLFKDKYFEKIYLETKNETR